MNSIKVCAVFLAAGQSSRMGENKLALPLKNTTVGSLALRAALQSELEHTFVVTKQDDELEWVEPAFFQSPFQKKWTLSRCQNSHLGQAHSLICGLKAALEQNPSGILILLADQPFVQSKTINQLISIGEQIRENKRDTHYIAASKQGKPRPPILFFQHMVPYLLNLDGDEGARQLIRNASFKGLLVEIKEENAFFDIDTKEDYKRAVRDSL